MDRELQRILAPVDRALKRYDKYLQAERRAHPFMYPPSASKLSMEPLRGCNCPSCVCFRAGGRSDIG